MLRRSFLAGILATGCAPALCKAGFLMPVKAIQPIDTWALLSDFTDHGPFGFASHCDVVNVSYENAAEDYFEAPAFRQQSTIVFSGMDLAKFNKGPIGQSSFTINVVSSSR